MLFLKCRNHEQRKCLLNLQHIISMEEEIESPHIVRIYMEGGQIRARRDTMKIVDIDLTDQSEGINFITEEDMEI